MPKLQSAFSDGIMNIRNLRILFLISVVFLAGSALLVNRSPHYSDETLTEVFQKNKTDFDLLARMAQEDANMIRIADDFTWTKDSAAFPRPESEMGITKERWDDYKKLFVKLGLKAGILNYQPEKIYFTSTTEGLLTGGSSKGFAFMIENTEIVFNSLDNFEFKSSGYAYKKLEGNWYLYYEVND